MRILRLDLAHGQSKLDLHPFLTVVRGLTPAQQDELLEAVRSLARGSTAGIRGLVQNQGLLVDLDGLGNDRLLSITGANVVVDCEGAESAGLAGLQAQIDQMERRAEIDAVVVEEIRADLDAAARARVAEIEAKMAPVDEEAVARRNAENDAVAESLAAVQALSPTVQEAPEGVLVLRRRWDAHIARRSGSEQHFATLMNSVKAAETRLAKARQAAELAAKDANPPFLTRAEETRLEALSFPEQDETRKGRWRKTLRPEEETEKADLLAKVHVDSWTAYTLYRASPSAPPEMLAASAAAAENVSAAERALAQVRDNLANDEITASLNDEADAVRADAREYLGQLLPSDLGAALRGLVVETPNPAWLHAFEALHRALVTYDVPIEPLAADSRPEADVIAAAGAWLDTRRRASIDFNRDQLQADLVVAKRELARHDRALVRIDRAELAAESSSARLHNLREQLAARAEGGMRSIDHVLTLIGPVAAQVELESGGSVPLVILGRFAGLDDGEARDLMGELFTLAQRLQIIVVSDQAAMADWADNAGLERALVARPRPVEQDRPPVEITNRS